MKENLGRIGGIALVTIVGLAGATLRAQSGTEDPGWTTGWTSLGHATAVTLDAGNPSHLFAGGAHGVAESVDGGRSWSLIPGTPASLKTIVLDPTDASRLFGGSDEGTFVSTDGGAHFTSTFSKPTAAIAVDPAHPQTVYGGGAAGPQMGTDGVRKSTDGGRTWRTTSLPFASTLVIASLVLDPSDENNVFAGMAPGDFGYGYYYYAPSGPDLIGSRDGGVTWRIFLDATGPAQTVNAVAFDPRSSQTIYAAAGSRVYRSIDGGARWTPSTFALGSIISSLVVDSMNPDTLYAGTDRGVFRSTDAGSHWAPLPELPSQQVTALALDAPGQLLHAATEAGVYEMPLAAEAPSYPCRPADDTLCLLGSRFRVRAQAWDRRSGLFAAGHAVPQSDGFGYFSLPLFTQDPALPEILVKMIGAEIPPWNDDWVFFDGLTDVWYIVTVTDTVTGSIRSYQNDPDSPYCGGADTRAFSAAALPGAPPPSSFPPLEAQGDALSLLSGRFQLTLSATDPHDGHAIEGRAIARQDGFGYFSLPDLTGDPSLPEVCVKMVDGRPLSGTFWIFVSGLTNVPYTLDLIDTIGGTRRTYTSPGAFCGSADTSIPGVP